MKTNNTMVGPLLFFAYLLVVASFNTFLDFVFWGVVGLVLWFALDTAKVERQRAIAEDHKHMEMETLDEPESKV